MPDQTGLEKYKKLHLKFSKIGCYTNLGFNFYFYHSKSIKPETYRKIFLIFIPSINTKPLIHLALLRLENNAGKK